MEVGANSTPTDACLAFSSIEFAVLSRKNPAATFSGVEPLSGLGAASPER